MKSVLQARPWQPWPFDRHDSENTGILGTEASEQDKGLDGNCIMVCGKQLQSREQEIKDTK